MSQRRAFYSSKLPLIVSKGGTNSADLHAEVELTTYSLSTTLTKGFIKRKVDIFSVNKCIKVDIFWR